MRRKLWSAVVCICMLCSLAAGASAAELKPDAVKEFPLRDAAGANIRILSAAAANVNGKKMLYGRTNIVNNKVTYYAFDVTDESAVKTVDTIVEDKDNGDLGMTVKDGYVICPHNKQLVIRKIEEDGSYSDTVSQTVQCSNQVFGIKPVDDLLFVNTSSNLSVYDASNMEEIVNLGVVEKTQSKDVAVEALGGGVYRICMIQNYPHPEVEKQNSMKIKILDVTVAGGSLNVEPLYEGIPIGSDQPGYAWPGFGVYGADTSVEGYLGFSTTNNGNINMVGSGLVRITMASGAAQGGVQNDDFILDISDPANPIVVEHDAIDRDKNMPWQAKLDESTYVCMTQYANSNGMAVIDFSSKNKNILFQANANGDTMTLLDNTVYAFVTGKLYAWKLYDAYKINSLLLEKTDTEAAATLSIDNNLGREMEFVMVTAAYSDGKMCALKFTPYTVLGNTKNEEFTNVLELPEASGAYTVRAWVIDHFGNMDVISDIITK